MGGELTVVTWAAGAAVVAAAGLLCAGLIVCLRPWLAHYALARPNARSSHKMPTPQGGGIAVLAATIGVSWAALYFLPAGSMNSLRLPIVCTAVLLIACVGVLADIHPENFAIRLLLQTLAVAAVILVIPVHARVLPPLPLPIERFLLAVGALWFVNLTNFMDGLDWMTVAEIVPVSGALAILGYFGVLPPAAVAVSLALCGGVLGFAWFNRPVATLFLGDVGSLPIGLIVAWLLILLAGNGCRVAAILLPLYYVADATITLLRRALNADKVWLAHRTHFYQRATDRGLSVIEVVGIAFALNIALAALAVATAVWRTLTVDLAALCVGAALVGVTLVSFARGKG